MSQQEQGHHLTRAPRTRKPRIAVLFGGRSSEHAISCVTAGSVRWRAGHEPRPFDPDHWLRTRAAEEVDLADIGALAVPTPSLADLNATIQAHYGVLRELDPEEQQLAETREQERHLALALLNELPGARLASLGLY